MDKETISEFGHVAISIIVAILLIVVIAGGAFTRNVRKMIDNSIPEHERQPYINDIAFEECFSEPVE